MTTIRRLRRWIQVGIALVGIVPLNPQAMGQDKVSSRSDSRLTRGSIHQVRKLYGINWYTSIDAAQEAAEKKAPPKAVFVLRTLGDLAGKT